MRKTVVACITAGLLTAIAPPAEAHNVPCTIAAYTPKMTFGNGLLSVQGRAYCRNMHRAGVIYPPDPHPIKVSDHQRIDVSVQIKVIIGPDHWSTLKSAGYPKDSKNIIKSTVTKAKSVNPFLPGTTASETSAGFIISCKRGENSYRTVVKHEIWGVGGWHTQRKESHVSTKIC